MQFRSLRSVRAGLQLLELFCNICAKTRHEVAPDATDPIDPSKSILGP